MATGSHSTVHSSDLASLDATISAMPMATLVVDDRSLVIVGNRLAGDLFGCDVCALRGRALDEFLCEQTPLSHDVTEALRCAGRALTSGGEVRCVRMRGGRRSLANAHCRAFSFADHSAVVVALDDRNPDEAKAELESFAYTASHDLQAPLRSISGLAELLMDRCGESLDPAAREWVRQISESTSQMQALIHDLLDYAKIDSARRPLEEVDLGPLVDDVIAVLAAEIEETGARVSRGALPKRRVDVPQMRQLLQNLIQNGLKYHGDASAHVHLDCVDGEREWILSCSDRGIGIAPEHHEAVFEAFRRLHTLDELPGTGIGLAVVRRVAKRHRGRAWVESEPGKGSTFFVAIPHDSRELESKPSA